MKLLLLLALSLSLFAWQQNQPGDYTYDDYSYQDYSYDVTPPTNSDYNYDTSSLNNEDMNVPDYQSPSDIDTYADDTIKDSYDTD